MKRARVSVSLLVVPLMFALGAAVISGGVAWSQGSGGAGWSGVDLTFFKGCCAAAALIVLIWRFAPIDWIGDDEIGRLQNREVEARTHSATGRARLVLESKFWTAAAALFLGFELAGLISGSNPLDAAWLGSFRILNRDWTGVELAMIIPLLLFLGWQLWRGIAHIRRLNHRPR